MGTYQFISIFAMLCYCFMFLTFLAAKKDKLVNSFLIVLVGMICWTGGSVLMRIAFWPSYIFWFHVSLCGILLLPYAYYRFVNAFAGVQNGILGKAYLFVMLLCFAVNIPSGILLKYPRLVEQGTRRSFVYDVDLKVAVYFLVAAVMLTRIFLTVFQVCRENKNLRAQFNPVLVGIGLLFLGNLGIGLPFFKGFPIDILCGLVNACLLLYALIRRKLFRLQMLASESVGYGVGLLFALIMFMNLSPYFQGYVRHMFSMSEPYYNLLFALFFFAAYWCVTLIWKCLVRNVFVKEEMQQAEKLQKFSSAVSKSLRLMDIMDAAIHVIKDTIAVQNIYICMRKENDGSYQAMYSDKPLNDLDFSLAGDNPIVLWLKKNEEPLLFKEFRYSVEYKSMWEIEKYQLEKKRIECCAGLKDEDNLIGIIFLTGKGNKGSISYSDIQILTSITSVSSIAIKNARLYEQAYLEARTDEMTGLLNRRYFYQVLDEEFEKNADGSLALAILNVDDFKLFNQLYGEKEGDRCLKRIADIIRSSVGDNGYAARYSGKEFAVLLPKYDVFSTKNLVESICRQIYDMNRFSEDYKLKVITVSAGISAAPYGAKSVKELMDNADLAVYHVKRNGKNGIKVFDTLVKNGIGLEEEGADNHAHIYQEYESTIYALTAAIDAKDHYTFSHSNNVAYYATELARSLGMNEEVVEIIRQSALLHDVGKIGIPEDILNKKGTLTEEEYEIIKGHVEASISIIRHLPSLDYVIPAVIGHHERYDGGGYPRRIAGEDIPATARVLCIADSFDAMTSKRCYKKPISMEKAQDILLEEAGRQFDPGMARTFVKCLQKGIIRLVDGEYSGNVPTGS